MFRMINPVQAYAWGSTTALSELFGWAPTGAPQAEVWMGAHPKAPSRILCQGGAPVPLDQHLRRHPEQLGSWEEERSLPFLLKVLAVATPLSIQAHPTRAQAATGFTAEEDAGVNLHAEERNYVDQNHKAELVVGLTDFAALCGFRHPEPTLVDLRKIRALLDGDAGSDAHLWAQALDELLDHLTGADFHTALRTALLDHREALAAAAERLAAVDADQLRGALTPTASDTLERITAAFPGDPGVFVALMLNRVDLRPGEALFLPAGNLHAYLGGVGVEVMANSDNVLRGGLTTKHVDVGALLEIVAQEVLEQPRLEPVALTADHRRYVPPGEEFALHRMDFPEVGLTHQFQQPAPAVAVCTRGRVSAGGVVLEAGESAFLPAGESAAFVGRGAQLFVATLPSVSEDQAVLR